MNARIDIHNYALKLKAAVRRIEQSALSSKNKELILEFHTALILEGLSPARQLKYLEDMRRFLLRFLKQDCDKATAKEIRDAVLMIEQESTFSPWTKHGYKVVVRKFWKWLEFGDEYLMRKEYPKTVSWIVSNIKKKDQPRVTASDLLTERDLEKLLEAADTVRDKAFISLLYELGARIGEIGNLKIKDVTRHKHGFLIDLYGKTGGRTPLIVMSTNYLSGWLAAHPDSKNPDAPLWVNLLRPRRGQALSYRTFWNALDRLIGRAQIEKRVYPHLFRHSRVTHLLAGGKINEAQAKVYFGWVPDSKMLSEYSHLVCGDVHKAILAIHGIVDDEKKENSSLRCLACATVNPLNASFCLKCGSSLKVMDAEEADKLTMQQRALIEQLMANPKVHKVLEDTMREIGL